MSLHQLHLRVRGRVQGVGFRWATSSEAKRLGLFGWVRNTEEGDVEILAEGEKEKVEALSKWCWQGPPTSRVTEVLVLQTSEVTKPSFSNFEIRR